MGQLMADACPLRAEEIECWVAYMSGIFTGRILSGGQQRLVGNPFKLKRCNQFSRGPQRIEGNPFKL